MYTSRSSTIASILDWQGACICPGLEHFKVPDFFAVDEDAFKFLLLDRQRGNAIYPESLDVQKLGYEDRIVMELEKDRALSLLRYANVVRERSGSDDLRDVILNPTHLLDALRDLIAYTPRSYEEGLIKLRSRIVNACMAQPKLSAYGSDPDLPPCMNEDDEASIERSTVPDNLAVVLRDRLIKRGIVTDPTGLVREDQLKVARKEMETTRSEVLKSLSTAEGKKALGELWPFQDGKWSSLVGPGRCRYGDA